MELVVVLKQAGIAQEPSFTGEAAGLTWRAALPD